MLSENNGNATQEDAIEIITAAQIHLPEIIDLFDAYRQFYRLPSDKAAAFRFLTLRLQMQDTRLYLAKYSLHPSPFSIVGFAHLFPSFSSLFMRRLWILNDLYVAEPYRGMGIGSRLIARAQLLAKETKAHGVFLQTEISNLPAQKIYEKQGFIRDEANYYYQWQTPQER